MGARRWNIVGTERIAQEAGMLHGDSNLGLGGGEYPSGELVCICGAAGNRRCGRQL